MLCNTRDNLLTPSVLSRILSASFYKSGIQSQGDEGRVCSATIHLDKGVASYITKVYQHAARDAPLYPGSAVFCRRWHKLLEVLGIGRSFALTPGSLRGGGAVNAYHRGASLQSLLWQLRLQHLTTLGYYLQEVSAASVLPSLPKAMLNNVKSAAALFPFLISYPPSAVDAQP